MGTWWYHTSAGAGQMPAVIILWSQLYHILFFLTKLQQPSTHLRVALATPLNFALISTWHVCHEKYFTFLSRATTTIMGDPNIFTACNIFAWQWNIFSLLSRPTISRSRSSCSCRSCWRPTRSATRTEQCGEKRRRNTRPRCQYSDPGWMRRTCDNQSLRATISSLLTTRRPGQPDWELASWPPSAVLGNLRPNETLCCKWCDDRIYKPVSNTRCEDSSPDLATMPRHADAQNGRWTLDSGKICRLLDYAQTTLERKWSNYPLGVSTSLELVISDLQQFIMWLNCDLENCIRGKLCSCHLWSQRLTDWVVTIWFFMQNLKLKMIVCSFFINH